MDFLIDQLVFSNNEMGKICNDPDGMKIFVIGNSQEEIICAVLKMLKNVLSSSPFHSKILQCYLILLLTGIISQIFPKDFRQIGGHSYFVHLFSTEYADR